MRFGKLVVALNGLILLVAAHATRSAPLTSDGMGWAYPLAPKQAAVAGGQEGDKPKAVQISGAVVQFSAADLTNVFQAVDWFPNQHPAMPEIVAKGRKPGVFACGFCHLPNGYGRPENASLAGLPVEYVMQQMADFRNGSRKSSAAGRGPTMGMIILAKSSNVTEDRAAAEYFTQIKLHSFVQIVEAVNIPKSEMRGWIYAKSAAGGNELLGQRIIEMPVNFEEFEKRDPNMRYVAYVPVGSVNRGAVLARNMRNPQFSCAACHGKGLRGMGNIPNLAGRSPTYIARQLNDFRSGARAGAASDAMKAVVKDMPDANVIDLAAYIGGLKP